MNMKAWNLQRGSYLWAKEVAGRAAELEQRLQELAALTGRPYDTVKEQVASLARASRADSLVIVSQLEYSHHYNAVRRLESPPSGPANRRTVRVLGKPFHWSAGLGGQLQLKAGESPW